MLKRSFKCNLKILMQSGFYPPMTYPVMFPGH